MEKQQTCGVSKMRWGKKVQRYGSAERVKKKKILKNSVFCSKILPALAFLVFNKFTVSFSMFT